MNIVVDGRNHAVEHSFSESRALINFDGLYVFVDKSTDGTWDLSGVPAQGEEKAVLKTFTDPTNDITVVTVTKTDE